MECFIDFPLRQKKKPKDFTNTSRNFETRKVKMTNASLSRTFKLLRLLPAEVTHLYNYNIKKFN